MDEIDKAIRAINFKKTISREEMARLIRDTGYRILRTMYKKSDREMKQIYQNAINAVEKEMNLHIGFNMVDENAINAIKNQDVFIKAYQGVGTKVTTKLNEVISNAYANPSKFTVAQIVKDMQDVSGEMEGTLTRIARTETNHISNVARMNSYMKVRGVEQDKFRWLNINDDRTTECCKAILRRTMQGVTMPQLKSIVEEEARNNGFTARDLTPHPNCRSTFIRIV